MPISGSFQPESDQTKDGEEREESQQSVVHTIPPARPPGREEEEKPKNDRHEVGSRPRDGSPRPEQESQAIEHQREGETGESRSEQSHQTGTDPLADQALSFPPGNAREDPHKQSADH